MTRRARAATAGLLLLTLSASAWAWIPLTLPAAGNPTDGTDRRWDLSSLPGGAIPFFINPAQPAGSSPIGPSGTTANDVISAVLAAFESWQGIATTTVKFSYQGQTGATNGFDGQNVVTFSPQGISFPPGSPRSLTVVTSAPMAGPVTLPGGGSITANFAGQILDADIVINPQGQYSVANLIPNSPVQDLQGIATHEVGHAIGLDHTGIQGATMYAFFTEGGGYYDRFQSQDERVAVSSLYPSSTFLAQTGSISGAIRRPDGTPVFGAHIDAIDTGTNSIVTSAASGLIAKRPDGMPLQFASNSGNFLLTGLSPGIYRISVEPLDGPGSPFLGGVFGDAGGGDSFFPLDYLPVLQDTPISVAAGQTSVIPAITVPDNSAASPNLDSFAFATVGGAQFLAPPMIAPGLPSTLSLGLGQNIVSNGALLGGVSFGIDDPNIQITGTPLIRTTDILLQLSPNGMVAPGPKLVTLDSPSGLSIFSGGVIVIPDAATAAAILPNSRSVTLGTTATAFATIINGGTSIARQCLIRPATQIPANFTFQTTGPATNAPTGSPDEPVDIAPGAAQSFVIAFVPSAAFAPTEITFDFACANAEAPANVGVNALLLSGSVTPGPDVIALALTPSGDGILDLPNANGANAFSVATTNLGAAGALTVTADTGMASVPVAIALCQTDPATGRCLTTAATSLPVTIASNATPSFGVFVSATAPIALAPGTNRIFLRIEDASGAVRGSTSVAVRTE